MEIPHLEDQSVISFYSSVLYSESNQMAFLTPTKFIAYVPG